MPSGIVTKRRFVQTTDTEIFTNGHYQRYADEVDCNTKANMPLYKRRQELAEHPFGTVKNGLGFSYFLTRGIENVRTETLLHFFAYNLKRVINIMGTDHLMTALQG